MAVWAIGHMASDLAKQKLPICAILATSIFFENPAEYMSICFFDAHKNVAKAICINEKKNIGSFSQNG